MQRDQVVLELTEGPHICLFHNLIILAYATLGSIFQKWMWRDPEVQSLLGYYVFSFTTSQVSITKFFISRRSRCFIELRFSLSWKYPGPHYYISTGLRLMMKMVLDISFTSQNCSLKLAGIKGASFVVIENGKGNPVSLFCLFNLWDLTFPPPQVWLFSWASIPKYQYFVHDLRHLVQIDMNTGRLVRSLFWRSHDWWNKIVQSFQVMQKNRQKRFCEFGNSSNDERISIKPFHTIDAHRRVSGRYLSSDFLSVKTSMSSWERSRFTRTIQHLSNDVAKSLLAFIGSICLDVLYYLKSLNWGSIIN